MMFLKEDRQAKYPPQEPVDEVFSISKIVPFGYNTSIEDDDSSQTSRRIMNPDSCSFRFIVLFFNCILTFGPYFCYDMPTVLQDNIQGKRNRTCERLLNGTRSPDCCSDCLGLSPADYNLLFAVFSWVNAVTVLFTGYLTDKLGNVVAVLTFSLVTLLGTSLFAGATTDYIRHTPAMFPLMLIGRMMLGSGNGGMRIVQDRVTAFWFRDKELAMAFGIMLSFSRLGSVLNFLVTAHLDASLGTLWTFVIGAGLCALGFLSAIVLSALDRHGVKRLDKQEQMAQSSKQVRPTDVRHFPGIFWLLVLTITVFYSAVLPFVADSSKYLQDEYRYSKVHASYIAGCVYYVSLVFSPVFGLLLDKFGCRALVSLGCTASLLTVYLILLLTHVNPIYLTITLGFSYTLAAISLWPSVTMVISSSHLGTAMGVTTCLLDVGRGISNLVVGKLLGDEESMDIALRTEKWSHVLIFLACIASLGFISSFMLNVLDRIKYKILNTPKTKKDAKESPLETSQDDDTKQLLGGNKAIN